MLQSIYFLNLSIKLRYFFCFLFTFNYGVSQNINIKYIGNKDEKFHFSYNFIEYNNDFKAITKNNRFLNFQYKNIPIISSNDYLRKTYIYAETNDSIEFNIDDKGLIQYYSKINFYRNLESKYINKSFTEFGPIELTKNKLLFLPIYKKKGISINLDDDYLKEKEYLESQYNENKISKPFYEYFKAIYWSLTIANKINNDSIDNKIIEEIENSFDNSQYLLNIYEYRIMLDLYKEKLIKQGSKKTNINSLKNQLNFILSNFTNQNIIDYLLFNQIKLSTKENIDDASIILFNEKCKNKVFLSEINEDQTPISFPIFSDIIKKQKGKLVFVDFWASWCMPCREEFAFYKRLIKNYPQISFVFISIDKSKFAWNKASSEYSYILNSENNFIIDKDSKDLVLQKIKLSSIPRYLLIGKDGNIINIDAPRPSSSEIEMLFKKYL